MDASLKECWDLYFDPDGWRSWVDGFEAVESTERYPESGSTLVWRSTPSGRGSVRERVLEHAPRTLHRIAFEDPESAGELETRFGVEGDGTRVTLELEYSLNSRSPLAAVTDRLFVRGQVRESLRRTLARFKHEVEDRVGSAETGREER